MRIGNKLQRSFSGLRRSNTFIPNHADVEGRLQGNPTLLWEYGSSLLGSVYRITIRVLLTFSKTSAEALSVSIESRHQVLKRDAMSSGNIT
jgi:hypothetical protein